MLQYQYCCILLCIHIDVLRTRTRKLQLKSDTFRYPLYVYTSFRFLIVLHRISYRTRYPWWYVLLIRCNRRTPGTMFVNFFMYVCVHLVFFLYVFYTFRRSFYPSTSSTRRVRADKSSAQNHDQPRLRVFVLQPAIPVRLSSCTINSMLPIRRSALIVRRGSNAAAGSLYSYMRYTVPGTIRT